MEYVIMIKHELIFGKEDYSSKLAEKINMPSWEFNSYEMCQVLDSITISEDRQITVKFLEGTEVDLQPFFAFCDKILGI